MQVTAEAAKAKNEEWRTLRNNISFWSRGNQKLSSVAIIASGKGKITKLVSCGAAVSIEISRNFDICVWSLIPPPFHTSSLTVKRQFFYNFTKGSPQNTTLRIFLVKGASASMLSRLVGGVLWETLGQPHNRALHIENTGQIIICFSEWCEFECSQGRWKVCFLKKTRNCE